MIFRVFLKAFCCWMLLIIFPGCGNNPVEFNKTKNVIMPLTVGNYWTYLVVLNYGTPDTLIMEITRQIPIIYAGETFMTSARIIYLKSGPRPNYEWLSWNGVDGLYTFGGIAADTDTFVIKNLELKFPASVGDSWRVPHLKYSLSDDRFFIKDTLTYSLVAKDEEFRTPAGIFKCYVYKFSEKPADDVVGVWDYFLYFSPGLGLVGEIIRDPFENDAIKGKLLLYDYFVR